MATTKTSPLVNTDSGFRLTDSRSLIDAVMNMNGGSSTYGIAAAGSTQATATALASVLNQVETATASQGVNLPLTTGRRTTPYQFAVVTNSTAVTIKVYGFKSSTDTINGIAGSTGIVQSAGSSVLYASVKPGAWFTIGSLDALPSGQFGTFTATGATEVVVANVNVTANSVFLFGLKTAAGTILGSPYESSVTPGTSFGVKCGASDTSVYNYRIIG